jgi:hypothetical protein
MFGALVSIVHFALALNALLRCMRERFVVGIVGAVGRAALMVAVVVLGFRLTFPGTQDPSAKEAAAFLMAIVFGPLISFTVLVIAKRRAQNAPAADEERLERPFTAWLPVAIIDAMFVVAALGARAIS